MKFLLIIFLFSVSYLQAQWVQLNSSFGKRITGLHVEGNTIIASTDSNGVFYSDNGGQSWTQRNSGITNLRTLSLIKRNNLLAVGTYGAGVFTSTNNGSSWSVSTTGMTLPYIYSLLITSPNNYILAGSGGNGGFISTNNGTNWSLSLGTTSIVNCYHQTPAGYLLSGAGPAIHKSTNEGVSWTQLVSGNTTMKDIVTVPKSPSGFNIFVGSLDGIFISTNEGVNWSTINSGLDYRNINSLAASGTNVFAGSYGGGVYLSTNNGTNWTKINTGLTNLFVQKLFIDGSYIYAGTENGVIWRRELSQVITSVENEDEVLKNFYLEQNYPNPFNPSTVIRYQLPVNGVVSLKVYDVLGNEIATLVDEYKEAGRYELEFNVGQTISLSTGVYIYRLTSGNFTASRKMLLMK
jgi:photosystem II stability/assembly factor-like uncharacterized protein